MLVSPPIPDLLRFLSAYVGSMVVPKRGSRKELLASGLVFIDDSARAIRSSARAAAHPEVTLPVPVRLRTT